MFSRPGNVSAFPERLRAALAPEYELLPELGRGGMGTVYLARDVALDCLVAVKVLRPELWTAQSVKQFVDEARILANLRHPNIVPVHSVHEKDGLNFYVMDYLEGDTLQSHLAKHGRLPVDAARKVGRDLLAALGKAHRKGVIHRDVKPANVFLDEEGGVLTDFGIARRITAVEQTDAQTLQGTAAYMAPEQFLGVEANERTDMYAAGMVIYEAFTGRRWEKCAPTDGDWTGVPLNVARVLRRAMELDPNDRWPHATLFRRELWRTRGSKYQWRTMWLSVGGVIVGAFLAAFTARAVIKETWPFHPSGTLHVVVAPFDDKCATRGRGGDRLARHLVRDLQGYVDFSVRGPTHPPWFLTRSSVVVNGVVCERGDSLRAEIRVAAGREADPAIAARGDTGHLDAVSDTLAYGIVREIWNRENPLDPVLPINALPRTARGLAAWLAAERLFAQARWGEADSAYATAEAIDSTCRLCYWRHREVQQWLAREPDSALMAHYYPHLGSFPTRYQSLMRAVSLPLRARLDALRQTTREWRDFFPAWFQLADELYHRGPLVGYSRAEAVEAFQMTAHLRPAFGPALEHLTWALTAEGDSAGARAAWSQLEALGDPSDPFTVALRALLRSGYASRFLDSVAVHGVIVGALASEGIQQFPGLAAGPRYIATFDAPTGAVEMGDLFAASPDRVLQRSGLIAAAMGRVSLGQLAAARADLGRLRDRPELELMEPELDGILLLLGFEARDDAGAWPRIAHILAREADSPSTPAGMRRRAAWLLTLASRKLGGADTARYQRLIAGEPMPRPLERLLTADGFARRGRYGDALSASDGLRELEAPALSGAMPVDPFFRTVLHVLRAEWSTAAGQASDAIRELLWYQNNDAFGLPAGDPQVGDVDWAFGTFARWRRAALLDREGRHDEACHAYRDVARLWSQGDPPYRARADSAVRRLETLGCKEAT